VHAPWSPMAAPPLPLCNDAEWDTCAHAYPAKTCPGDDGPHDLPPLPPLIPWLDHEGNLLRLQVEAALTSVLRVPTQVILVHDALASSRGTRSSETTTAPSSAAPAPPASSEEQQVRGALLRP
jgi:hypothetical protein